MLIDRKILEQELTQKCNSIVVQKVKWTSKEKTSAEKLCDKIYEEHKIPTGIVMDCLSGRTKLSETSEAMLYILLNEFESEKIKKYFTEKEIKLYSNIQYAGPKSIDFPFEISCIQVKEGQWIGSTDSNFFISLDKSNMIRYNPDTQRPMTKSMKGGIETWRYTVNKESVKEIKESLLDGSFFSNTITLNISDESECVYVYNEKEKKLIIKSIDHFDINDGYHRFLAMCQAYAVKDTFNYPMEIRITEFSPEKSRQMIFQEDQKTKMTKLQSNSLNLKSDANFVVERLNSTMDSCFKDLISRNQGIIDYSWMSAVINELYFKNNPTSKESKYKTQIAAELKGFFNSIFEDKEDMLQKPISKSIITALLYISKEDAVKTKVKKASYVLSEKGQQDLTELLKGKDIGFSKKNLTLIETFIKDA